MPAHNDLRLPDFWHLFDTVGINVTDVAIEFAGTEVIVGASDEGTDFAYLDFAPMYGYTRDFNTRGYDFDAVHDEADGGVGTAVVSLVDDQNLFDRGVANLAVDSVDAGSVPTLSGISTQDLSPDFVAHTLVGDDGGPVADDPPGGGDPPPGAPGAPGPLQLLADYLRVGFWNDFLGGASQRYYNVDDNGTGANFGTISYNVTWSPDDSNGVSAARAVLVRESFNLYEAVLGIDFVETTATDTSVDFFFGDNVAGQAYAYSVTYSGNSGPIDYSVINVASGWYGGSSTIGDYSFQTFLHEIGHGLGLGHQGNYNAGAGAPTYSNSAIWENDSWQLTMMSYWDQVSNTSASTTGATYAFLVTPMTVDWIALNDLYGGQDYAGRSFGVDQAFTGNTVWGVGTNIAGAVSAAFNGLAGFGDSNAFTIVDGGGVDTIDFSIYSANQTIDLNPASPLSTNATISSVGGYTGNMTIAAGTVIENVVGGSGSDTITGNTSNNVLTGGLGNDVYVFNTGFGNDTVVDTDGTPGNLDVIRFGTGIAPGAVAVSRSGLDLVLANGVNSATVQNWYASAADKVERVEFVDSPTVWDVAQLRAMTNLVPTVQNPIADQNVTAGAAFNYVVASNAFADADAVIGDTLTYTATRADDTALPSWLTFNPATRAFSGTPGAGDTGVLSVKVRATDTEGASAFDLFDVTVTGSSVINGTAGNDTLTGTSGDDVINGLDGNDTLSGLGGNDALNGGIGNDALNGGTGADTMTGGTGNDTYTVDNIGDVVIENAGEGSDVVFSSVNYTLSANVENLNLTGSAAINATGNSLNNQLTGNNAANVMAGGLGNDGYYITAGDTVIENAGEGTDYVLSTISYALTANVENLTLVGTAANNGTGNELNNVIAGNTAANVLDGGAGADNLSGGLGDDTYVVDSTSDVVTEAASAGFDSVQASASFTLGANVENLTLTGISAINGTGNTLNNSITGNGAANTLIGGAGNDTLTGAGGNDIYRFDAGFGVDTIADADATPGNLDIIRFETTIVAASVFAVRSGLNLLLTQGANSITVQNWYASDANKIERVEFLADGTAWDATQLRAMTNFAPTVQSPIADQNVAAGAAFNFTVTSNAFADADAVIGDILTYSADLVGGEALPSWLTFNPATLEFSGTPTSGDAGTINVRVTATDAVGASVSDAFDLAVTGGNTAPTVQNPIIDQATPEDAVFTFTVPANTFADADAGDTLTYSATRADDTALPSWLSFDALSRTFSGTPLNGDVGTISVKVTATDGASASVSDTFELTISNTNDAPTLAIPLADQGATSGTAFGYTFAAGSFSDVDPGDTLTYTATRADDTALPSWLTFNPAMRAFSGTPGGGDVGVLNVKVTATDGIGASVSDIFDVTVAPSPVINGTAGPDTLTGSSGDDVINGLGDNDTLNGLGGNDTLDGGTGNDTMLGGSGNDTYVVDSTSDIVTEAVGEGTDTVQSSVTWTLGANVENLTLTGTGNINGTGNTLANVLVGNSGANTLNGGTGADTMSGGAGNDSYIVDSAGDTVTELAGEGTDTVGSSVSYTLGANVENLALIGSAAVNGTGNELNNQLTGNGNAAANVLAGGLGNDTYYVGAGDTVIENAGEGTDAVFSAVSFALGVNVENLTLTGAGAINGSGNALNNVINGNSGANVLAGGAGADTITGGAGMDAIRFDTLPDLLSIDQIIGYVTADDTIQFENDIFTSFANPGVLAANLFRSGAGVTTAADADDYLIYNTTNGALYYDADGSLGGFTSQQVATLTGLPPLTADDFFIT